MPALLLPMDTHHEERLLLGVGSRSGRRRPRRPELARFGKK
jgi:hypothetical protein